MTATCCFCGAPCEVAVLDHRPAPDRSLCPDCRAENTRILLAIPQALRDKAERIRLEQEDAPSPTPPAGSGTG